VTPPAWLPPFDVHQRNLFAMGLGVLALAVLKVVFPYALHFSPITFIGWYLVVLGVAGFAMVRGTNRLLADDGYGSRLTVALWLLLMLVLSAQVINATQMFQQALRPFQARAQSLPDK